METAEEQGEEGESESYESGDFNFEGAGMGGSPGGRRGGRLGARAARGEDLVELDQLATAVPAEALAGGDRAGADDERARRIALKAALEPPALRTPSAPRGAELLVAGPQGALLGLELASLRSWIEVEGPRARVLLEHVYKNPHDRELEGSFFFPLPDGASVSYFGMDIDPSAANAPGAIVPDVSAQADEQSGPRAELFAAATSARVRSVPVPSLDEPKKLGSAVREARVVEAVAARRAYEDIVRRNVDPALLEWAGGDHFRGRVFPIPAGGLKRVLIAYERTLPMDGEALRLDLPLPKQMLRDLAITLDLRAEGARAASWNLGGAPRAEAGLQRYTYELRNGVPEVDLELRVEPTDARAQAIAGRRAEAAESEGAYFYARVRPEIPAVTRRFAKRAIFAVDTSLSEVPARFEARAALVQRILEKDRELEAFALLFFDLDARWVAAEWIANDELGRARAKAALASAWLEGATNLEAAVRAVASAPFLGAEPVDLFLLTDGMITWGAEDPRALAEMLRASATPLRTYGYRVGDAPIARALFHELARASGGALFEAPTASALDDVALAHTRQALELGGVIVDGAEVLELHIEGEPRQLFPGQELRLAGRLRSVPRAMQVIFELGGGASGTAISVPLALANADRASLAARAWAQMHVEALAARRDLIAERLEIAYAQRFGVATQRTSLLVLENDDDYRRFDVDAEEAAAADPELLEALADWRRQREESGIAVLLGSPEHAQETALGRCALEVLAAARRGALDEALPQRALAEILARTREAGDLRRGAETLFEHALATEALAVAARAKPECRDAAQSALRFLVEEQHGAGSFGSDRRRPPHVATTYAAARALREARRSGLRGTFAAGLLLDRFCASAPRVDAEARFAAASWSLAALRAATLASDAERALRGAVRERLATAVGMDRLELLALAWPALERDAAPAERDALRAAIVRDLFEDRVDDTPAAEAEPHSALARALFEAWLQEPSAEVRAQEAALDEQTGRDPAALFASYDAEAPSAKLDGAAATSESLSAEELARYRAEREAAPLDPEVYARWAHVRHQRGDVRGALRALSSIVERFPRDAQALRLAAYFLLEWNATAEARALFDLVRAARPFEPHAHRDLAALDAREKRFGLSAIGFERVLDGEWHPRFGSMALVVRDEYARALRDAAADAALPSAERERFAERLEQLGAGALAAVDLRVTIGWNTDATDIDLWVTEPGGEKCYYQHKETAAGGRLLEDLTQGYGPERYELAHARAGTYRVEAHYFGGNPSRLGGLTFVSVDLARHAGTAQEVRERRTLLLRRAQDVALLAEVRFP
ncbi:MAG: hypothetical protein JNM84_11440 [Planctomycetes bacterium]|nr:hypothetical protein [Planctomycetota bacterium]